MSEIPNAGIGRAGRRASARLVLGLPGSRLLSRCLIAAGASRTVLEVCGLPGLRTPRRIRREVQLYCLWNGPPFLPAG